MNRNFPAHQGRALAQLHTTRTIPSIKHAQTTQSQQEEDKTIQAIEQNNDNQQKTITCASLQYVR